MPTIETDQAIEPDNELQRLAELHLPGYGYRKQLQPEIPAPAVANDSIMCSSTRRIVLISPHPNLLHELIRDLSAACYDVMVFHRVDDYVLHSLPADLYLIDSSAGDILVADPGFRTFVADPAKHDRTILLASGGSAALEHCVLNQFGFLTATPEEALERAGEWLLRHPAANEGDHQGVLGFKDLTLDTKRMEVFRGGSRIDLTKTEYELLLRFIQEEGAVQTREHLMEDIWGAPFYGNSNVVDVHVKSLRRKLGDNALAPTYVETVRGVGYRLAD